MIKYYLKKNTYSWIIMDNFEESAQTKLSELAGNLSKFLDKNNNSAGTKVRKNAQELKTMLQELRVNVLDLQKSRKEEKASKKK